jgi:phage N-6-adenine-methyltransferase
MNNELMFSSKTDDWETPIDFFNEINKEFYFNFDACASEQNAKCKQYCSKEQDGLAQQWGDRTWCNPPYGREIGRWVRKAYEESRAGKLVVMLIPARTDTKWFHEYIYNKAGVEIRFIKGRLKFGNSKSGAPFPSMLVVFKIAD